MLRGREGRREAGELGAATPDDLAVGQEEDHVFAEHD